MAKYTTFVAIALSVHCLVCILHFAEAQRDEEGYCYMKIRKRTGECKKRMKLKQGKGDCCSNGGAGWSLTKRGRDSCEPCKSLFSEPSVWGDWGQWSTCNATCGPSFQVKRRECISSGVKNCKGKSELVRSCRKPPCPIHGGWSTWGNWSICSKTCGTGYQVQSRTCSNPTPKYGGRTCQGPLQQSRSCEKAKYCPIHGGWGEWGEWSACSQTCGLGKQTRDRKCNSPEPQYGGRPCNESEKIGGKYCRRQRCEDIVQYSGSGGSAWSSGSGSGSGSGSLYSGEGGWETSHKTRAWSDDEDDAFEFRRKRFTKKTLKARNF